MSDHSPFRMNPNVAAGEMLLRLREIILTSPDFNQTEAAEGVFEHIVNQISNLRQTLHNSPDDYSELLSELRNEYRQPK